MASYVEGALIPGESVTYTGNLSLWGLSHLIIAGLVLLPVFALMLKIVYAFKRRLYMEHLIVALHSHAFLCLTLLLLFVANLLERWFAPDYRQRAPAEFSGYRNMLTRMPAEGYIGTCGCKSQCCGPPNTPGGASHEGGSSGQTRIHLIRSVAGCTLAISHPHYGWERAFSSSSCSASASKLATRSKSQRVSPSGSGTGLPRRTDW